MLSTRAGPFLDSLAIVPITCSFPLALTVWAEVGMPAQVGASAGLPILDGFESLLAEYSLVVTVCASCGTENPAGQKFCGECGLRLAAACSVCGTENPPGQKFCGECGAPLGGSLGSGPSGSAPAPGASAGTDAPNAERRLVSVLFADLVGFTTLSEARDSEDVRDLLSRYFDACRTVVERYGGTVEKFIGDAVMAVWGAPIANEDDAERGGLMKSEGLEPPFVGRDRELKLAKDLFHASVEEGKAHLVQVSGIAGIGKSRLGWEVFKYLDGLQQLFLWHRGRCLAYGE